MKKTLCMFVRSALKQGDGSDKMQLIQESYGMAANSREI